MKKADSKRIQSGLISPVIFIFAATLSTANFLSSVVLASQSGTCQSIFSGASHNSNGQQLVTGEIYSNETIYDNTTVYGYEFKLDGGHVAIIDLTESQMHLAEQMGAEIFKLQILPVLSHYLRDQQDQIHDSEKALDDLLHKMRHGGLSLQDIADGKVPDHTQILEKWDTFSKGRSKAKNPGLSEASMMKKLFSLGTEAVSLLPAIIPQRVITLAESAKDTLLKIDITDRVNLNVQMKKEELQAAAQDVLNHEAATTDIVQSMQAYLVKEKGPESTLLSANMVSLPLQAKILQLEAALKNDPQNQVLTSSILALKETLKTLKEIQREIYTRVKLFEKTIGQAALTNKTLRRAANIFVADALNDLDNTVVGGVANSSVHLSKKLLEDAEEMVAKANAQAQQTVSLLEKLPSDLAALEKMDFYSADTTKRIAKVTQQVLLAYETAAGAVTVNMDQANVRRALANGNQTKALEYLSDMEKDEAQLEDLLGQYQILPESKK